MSYDDIRNAREGFVDMSSGDRLISIESRIVGVVVFIAMLAYFKTGFVKALIVGACCIFAVPKLVGLISVLGWIFGIAFSIIWAVLGYFIGGAILGDNVLAGLLIAVVIFTISMLKHKVFSGLGYSSVLKHELDSLDATRDNTSKILRNSDVSKQSGDFCPNCGATVKLGASFCSKCGGKV